MTWSKTWMEFDVVAEPDQVPALPRRRRVDGPVGESRGNDLREQASADPVGGYAQSDGIVSLASS